MFPSLIRHPILCGSSAVVFFLAATPALAVECSDGIDNDGDGLIDFPDDPGCADALQDIEDPDCSDGFDDDSDTLTDFPADPGCTSPADLSEKEFGLACDDGVDNDGDLASDFRFVTWGTAGVLTDRGCLSAFDSDEQSPDLPCDDGIDNDGDGLIDYPNDPGCGNSQYRTESPDCDDGQDNDGDGLTDHAEDFDCDGAWAFSERPNACADGIDNDGDGLVDGLEDPGCQATFDLFELNPVPITGGTITGYACEAGAMNCKTEADFAVTSSTVATGSIRGLGAKFAFNFELDVPEIVMEGGFGDVARVEVGDLVVSSTWFAPFGPVFGQEPLPGSFVAFSIFSHGTIEELDAQGISLSGPIASEIEMSDVFGYPISYCTIAEIGETGRCELFLDTANNGSSSQFLETVDIGGTPHRIAWQFDLTLNSVPDFDGDGVLDHLDNCSEAFNPAQDDTDGDFCGNLCDANYDGSGAVGFGDFGAFAANFGTTNELYQHLEPIGGGERVGFEDFGFFTAHFGTVPGPSGTTPGTVACP